MDTSFAKKLADLKSLLVIGSNSFTGAHLIDHLLRVTTANVVGMSRSIEYSPIFLPYKYLHDTYSKRFAFRQIDINREIDRFERICDEFRPEFVFNFAAQGEVRNSWNWPVDWYETNCLGIVKVSEVLRKKSYIKRYVAASTPEVYGSSPENKFIESNLYDPSTPYAASKLSGDLHLRVLFKKEGFPVIFTRSANIYGIHQQLYRIIPRTIIFLRLARKIRLHGRGESRRVFIHARDVADATLRAATLGITGECYHISTDLPAISVSSVVRKICDIMDRDFDQCVEYDQENFGQDALYDLASDKARIQLDWAPVVSFQDGISEVINWVDKNWTDILLQPLDYIHKSS